MRKFAATGFADPRSSLATLWWRCHLAGWRRSAGNTTAIGRCVYACPLFLDRNPIWLCVPSQNGLLLEPPQRHNHYCRRNRFAFLSFESHRLGFVPKADIRAPLDATYSITTFADASRPGGTLIPIALAVDRLMTSSNWVGCTTGMSAGFSPLRIRPV